MQCSEEWEEKGTVEWDRQIWKLTNDAMRRGSH
jgi:hypothetical protein